MHIIIHACIYTKQMTGAFTDKSLTKEIFYSLLPELMYSLTEPYLSSLFCYYFLGSSSSQRESQPYEPSRTYWVISPWHTC